MTPGGIPTKLIVGAYAAAPPDLDSSPDLEEEWYRLLRAMTVVGGLELAFTATLHPHGIAHLARLLAPDWRNVVTCIPGTGRILSTDPQYGLASDDTAGRRRAIEGIRVVHTEVTLLKNLLGAESVQAVQVQSAPNRARAGSSSTSLAASLEEIASWDWQGTALMVEHCDAFLPDVSWAPQKGFLTLPEEITAVAGVSASQPAGGTVIGHTVNWARSVIETHDHVTPVRQLEQIVASGAATAIMFSGVSATATTFGDAWSDAHLPVAPRSLLTAEAIRQASAAAGRPLYAGVKVGADRNCTSLADRLEPSVATLDAFAW